MYGRNRRLQLDDEHSYVLSQREIASAFRRKSRCMGELELRAIAMALETSHQIVGASILRITDNHEPAVNNPHPRCQKFVTSSISLVSQLTGTPRTPRAERRTGALTSSRNIR